MFNWANETRGCHAQPLSSALALSLRTATATAAAAAWPNGSRARTEREPNRTCAALRLVLRCVRPRLSLGSFHSTRTRRAERKQHVGLGRRAVAAQHPWRQRARALRSTQGVTCCLHSLSESSRSRSLCRALPLSPSTFATCSLDSTVAWHIAFVLVNVAQGVHVSLSLSILLSLSPLLRIALSPWRNLTTEIMYVDDTRSTWLWLQPKVNEDGDVDEVEDVFGMWISNWLCIQCQLCLLVAHHRHLVIEDSHSYAPYPRYYYLFFLSLTLRPLLWQLIAKFLDILAGAFTHERAPCCIARKLE